MKLTEKTIRENIEKNNLILPGEAILVSYSGGPDSTALLHILNKLSKSMKFTMAACYINHNIRDRKTIENEIWHCRSLCDSIGISFIVLETNIPMFAKEEKLSIEEAGHIFRKQALLDISRDEGFAKVATGHHLDDQIETILFRLFRGTGPGGLNPIRPKSGLFIRPLSNIPKPEIIRYNERNRLNPIVDKTNLESTYTRNYIRNEIIPVIDKKFGGSFKKSLIGFAEITTEENEFLRDIALITLNKIISYTPGKKLVVDLKKLAGYDLWLRRRLIKECLEIVSGRVGTGSFDDIERVDKIIAGRIKASDLAGGIRAVSDSKNLYFLKGRTKIKQEELKAPILLKLESIDYKIKLTEIPVRNAVLKIQKRGFMVDIDCEKLTPPLHIRGISAGDSFVPLGMTGKKKIGDFLTDKKVSKFIRDEIPVIEDKRGIIWLAGYQIADRVKIDNKTKRVLRIDLIKGKKAKWPEI